MGNLRKEHWQTMECIFRYLKGTTDIGLVYHGNTSYTLAGYPNSDYATDLDVKRFMIGYAFMIGNSFVSWKATLQPTATLSTIEAKCMALAKATKEGIWLKGQISNLGFKQEKAIVFCDNLNAICLAKDQVYHERTKDIDIGYHFIHSEKRVEVQKVDTRENPTDMFTKLVPRSKFMHCLNLLYVDCWE